jgi:hypothetical protein
MHPIRAGLRSLVDWPLATGAALVSAMAAALAGAAALRRAGVLFRRAMVEDSSQLRPAFAVALAGIALARLLLTLAEAIALAASATSGGEGSPLWRGMARMPALITLCAVETTVLMMLALGAAAGIAKASDLAPARAALASTLVLAPVMIVAAAAIGGTRVAVALAARGLAPADALVHGLDAMLRRFPSLVRLSLALFCATLPLTAGALLLSLPHHAAPLRHSLQAALIAAATLWSYASLEAWAGAWAGRDPRLASD